MKPDGEYWVFLEVNGDSYGGRPASDGPDIIDSLMANTRNNPLEDPAVHLPMICDRYELRDDVMPGAGRFRSGLGVVKRQHILTDGFIAHECEQYRHEDVPWGIFGGHEGQCGALQIYNAPPAGRHHRHAGEVRGASGLQRRRDGVLWSVRGRLRGPVGAAGGEGAEGRAGRFLHGGACAGGVRGWWWTSIRRPWMWQRRRRCGRGGGRSEAASRGGPSPVEELVARLSERLGDDWSFDVQRHHRNGGGIEVTAELKSNGIRVQRTGTSNGNRSLPLGAQIEMASEAAFRSCTQEMLGATGRRSFPSPG